jgi:uncharacterized protein YdhG (YjbR/CyaY superfamily)
MKKPSDVDAYLAALSPEPRAALDRLRTLIRTAAPQATEGISWGMPMFKYQGLLVGFAAFKQHCSLFPMNSSLIPAFRRELARFETAKGTIRFTPDHPLPAALVRQIVRVRMKENEARQKERPGKKR